MRCSDTVTETLRPPPTERVDIDDDRASKNGCDKEEYVGGHPFLPWAQVDLNIENVDPANHHPHPEHQRNKHG
jgi:hypothetical protein